MEYFLSILMIPFLIILPAAALIALQIYLSKMKQAWPGLILPVISTINATFITFLLFVNSLANNMTRIFLLTIILYIPSAVFFFIFKKFHRSHILNHEISRMTIQDLD